MKEKLKPIERIKVFVFIDSFRIGGMHRQILYLVKHINKEIFEPIVCTSGPAGGLKGEYEKTGCKLICLDWKGRYDFGIIFRLVKVLKNEQPDIVFITEVHNLVYFRIAKLFWWKKVVQIGSYRALTFWIGHDNKRLHFVDNMFSKWLYNSSDYITANSEALKKHYSNIVKLKEGKAIEVIYNGSDFSFNVTKKNIEIRKELGISPNEIIITMIARLDPWKDFNTFLEASNLVLKTEINAKFIIVGDGELRAALEQLIMKLGLKKSVLILGEKKDIYNYHNLADISVLSTNGEGFSNSILEAMALGKPIIATDVGGNSELLGKSGKCGLLVPPKSPIILADEMIRLIRSEALRNEIGASAKERIHQLCDIKKYVSSYESLFLKTSTIFSSGAQLNGIAINSDVEIFSGKREDSRLPSDFMGHRKNSSL